MRPLIVRWLGRTRYADTEALQSRLVPERRRNEVPDTLLLLEHPPVITLGRGAERAHLLLDPAGLERRGIELHECGRGGDVTYHGPGQLVGYPVVALAPERRDVQRYLRDLERALIDTAADFGVAARRVEGLTGIWVGQDKLAAIGVRVSTGWITSHGFALNVGRDLSGFSAIVPCGLHGRGVTSLGRLLDRAPPLPRVAAAAAGHLARVLGLRAEPAPDARERLARADGGELCWS